MSSFLPPLAAAALGNAIYFAFGVLFGVADRPGKGWRVVNEFALSMTGFGAPPFPALQLFVSTPLLCVLMVVPGYFVYTRGAWESPRAFVLAWGLITYGTVWVLYRPIHLFFNGRFF